MSACVEIEDILDVEGELTRIRRLMRLVYASATSNDLDLSEIEEGLVWMVSDLGDKIDRVIAGIQKIQEAGP